MLAITQQSTGKTLKSQQEALIGYHYSDQIENTILNIDQNYHYLKRFKCSLMACSSGDVRIHHIKLLVLVTRRG